MFARFPSTCPACGTRIASGAQIVKHATLGKYVHEACANASPAVVNAAARVVNVRRPAASDLERWAASGLVRVAGLDPDRASVLNGVGFSRRDVEMGHSLARQIVAGRNLTDRQWTVVVLLARKYRRQIPAASVTSRPNAFDTLIASSPVREADAVNPGTAAPEAANWGSEVRWFDEEEAALREAVAAATAE